MTTEENVGLVRCYFEECVNRLNGPDQDRALEVVDELLDADFVMFYNSETGADSVRGRERHKDFLMAHARTFPDDKWTVEAMLADAELVACRWRIKAKHAETGNAIDVRAADFFTVRNGRLAELRRFLDFESFQRQLRSTATDGEAVGA